MMLSGEVLAPEASRMDLTAAVSGLQQSKVLGEVQIAVARKLLDQQRLDGSAAVQLIEAASKGVNQSGDQLAAAATGLGGAVDVYG
jgi:hypothetical protein